MSQANTSPFKDTQAEIAYLRQELQVRDQLVQQLSEELFRLLKDSPAVTSASEERASKELQTLRYQFKSVEKQIAFYQEQIANRDAEIAQLRQSVQELGDRNQMLEQVVQDLPDVYRQKFAERIGRIKEQIASLQRENRQLTAELQGVTYRLAIKARAAGPPDLPNFPPLSPGEPG